MNSIWRNSYDHYKDRGYGGLFLVSFLICSVVAILVWKFLEASRYDTLVYWLPGTCLFACACGWSILRRKRGHRDEPWKNQPLSNDELRKARSKLTNRSLSGN